MDCKLLKFRVIGDERGNLVSLEGSRNITFDIKRVYYMYGMTPGIERGKHAHIHLKQVIVCVSGSCTFILDDGKNREEIELNKNPSNSIIRTIVISISKKCPLPSFLDILQLFTNDSSRTTKLTIENR